MKMTPVGLLIGLACAGGAQAGAAEVTQTTGNGSWCSPALSGNGITVICNGVDPRAMDRLNELLDRKDLDLKQKTAEANDWVRRYNELNAQLEETKRQLASRGEIRRSCRRHRICCTRANWKMREPSSTA